MCTKRAARNLCYQGFMKEEGNPSILLELTGQDILGLALSAPLAHYKIIYTLPMLTIKVHPHYTTQNKKVEFIVAPSLYFTNK